MVAGSGIVLLIFAVFFAIVIIPLMMVLILKNIGAYGILGRGRKILFYFFSYFLLVVLEFMLIGWLKEKALEPLFYFFLYLLLLLFFTYALKSILQNYTQNSFFTVLMLTLLVIIGIYIKIKPKVYIANPEFEKQFVKALGLKYIAADSLYASNALVIEKDTIAGFYENIEIRDLPHHPHPKCFFIQSIEDLKYRKIIDMTGWIGSEYYIDYANGAIHTSGTGYGYLDRMIYPDTTEAEGYVDSLGRVGFPTKRLVYKSKLIIMGGGGFHIFDINSQKLLYTGSGMPYINLLGNKLIYVSSRYKDIIVKCLDVDRLKVIWSRKIDGEELLENHLFNDITSMQLMFNERVLAVATNKGLQLLSLLDEKPVRTIPLPDTKTKWIYHQMDKSNIYLSTDSIFQCINSENGKKLWQKNSMHLSGLYHEQVIALSTDNSKYYLLDRNTGKVLNTVPASLDDRFRIFDKYMIISSSGKGRLYQ